MESPPRFSERPWLAFAVAGTAIYLTVLDLFIVNVAIESIGADFGTDTAAELSWVLTVYAIMFAAVLVPAGTLGDRFGRRRLFLVGLALFLVGSLLAGVASGYAILLVGRAIQAVGAAVATPNSLGAVLPMFAPQRRPVVLGVWGTIAASGAASGPPLGGLLAQADWRWIFLINLPVGLLALVAAPRVMKESRTTETSTRTDWIGALALAGAIGSITLAFAQGPEWGWGLPVVGSIATAMLLGAVVVLRARSHPHPIIEPALFRRPGFGASLLATAAFWGSFAGLLLASSLYLTAVRGYDVLEAGLRLAPGPAISAVAAAVAGRLAGRIAPIALAVSGTAALAIGAVLLGLSLSDDASYLWAFLPGSLLAGVGAGTAIPNLLALALVGIPPNRYSTGVAVYTVFRQIGAAVGTAVWVASVGTASLAIAANYRLGWWAVAGLAVIALVSLAFVARPARTPPDVSGPVPETTGIDVRQP
ncbi:MFS transporter [Agromyces sp. NPDC049794]|uniref:MFS transporter n=1 Tax=unclassified Agromyces TaxID=2639701 RepID=UPI0034115864